MQPIRKRSLPCETAKSKSPRLLYKSDLQSDFLSRPAKEILTQVAPHTRIGIYKTDFWNPDLPKSLIYGGTATLNDRIISSFNRGKKATEQSLCVKVLREFDLLDSKYGRGFTKKKFHLNDLHPKETENLRLCLLDTFFKEDGVDKFDDDLDPSDDESFVNSACSSFPIEDSVVQNIARRTSRKLDYNPKSGLYRDSETFEHDFDDELEMAVNKSLEENPINFCPSPTHSLETDSDQPDAEAISPEHAVNIMKKTKLIYKMKIDDIHLLRPTDNYIEIYIKEKRYSQFDESIIQRAKNNISHRRSDDLDGYCGFMQNVRTVVNSLDTNNVHMQTNDVGSVPKTLSKSQVTDIGTGRYFSATDSSSEADISIASDKSDYASEMTCSLDTSSGASDGPHLSKLLENKSTAESSGGSECNQHQVDTDFDEEIPALEKIVPIPLSQSFTYNEINNQNNSGIIHTHPKISSSEDETSITLNNDVIEIGNLLDIQQNNIRKLATNISNGVLHNPSLNDLQPLLTDFQPPSSSDVEKGNLIHLDNIELECIPAVNLTKLPNHPQIRPIDVGKCSFHPATALIDVPDQSIESVSTISSIDTAIPIGVSSYSAPILSKLPALSEIQAILASSMISYQPNTSDQISHTLDNSVCNSMDQHATSTKEFRQRLSIEPNSPVGEDIKSETDIDDDVAISEANLLERIPEIAAYDLTVTGGILLKKMTDTNLFNPNPSEEESSFGVNKIVNIDITKMATLNVETSDKNPFEINRPPIIYHGSNFSIQNSALALANEPESNFPFPVKPYSLVDTAEKCLHTGRKISTCSMDSFNSLLIDESLPSVHSDFSDEHQETQNEPDRILNRSNDFDRPNNFKEQTGLSQTINYGLDIINKSKTILSIGTAEIPSNGDDLYDPETDTISPGSHEDLVSPNEDDESPSQSPKHTSPMPDFMAKLDMIARTTEEYDDGWNAEPEPDINYDPIQRIKMKFQSRTGVRTGFEQVHHFERRNLYVVKCFYPGGDATGAHADINIAKKVAAYKALQNVCTKSKHQTDSPKNQTPKIHQFTAQLPSQCRLDDIKTPILAHLYSCHNGLNETNNGTQIACSGTPENGYKLKISATTREICIKLIHALQKSMGRVKLRLQEVRASTADRQGDWISILNVGEFDDKLCKWINNGYQSSNIFSVKEVNDFRSEECKASATPETKWVAAQTVPSVKPIFMNRGNQERPSWTDEAALSSKGITGTELIRDTVSDESTRRMNLQASISRSTAHDIYPVGRFHDASSCPSIPMIYQNASNYPIHPSNNPIHTFNNSQKHARQRRCSSDVSRSPVIIDYRKSSPTKRSDPLCPKSASVSGAEWRLYSERNDSNESSRHHISPISKIDILHPRTSLSSQDLSSTNFGGDDYPEAADSKKCKPPAETRLSVKHRIGVASTSNRTPPTSSLTKQPSTVPEIIDFNFNEDKDVVIDYFSMLKGKFPDYDFEQNGGVHIDNDYVFCSWRLPPHIKSDKLLKVKIKLPQEFQNARKDKNFLRANEITKKCAEEARNSAGRLALNELNELDNNTPIIIDSEESDDEIISERESQSSKETNSTDTNDSASDEKLISLTEVREEPVSKVTKSTLRKMSRCASNYKPTDFFATKSIHKSSLPHDGIDLHKPASSPTDKILNDALNDVLKRHVKSPIEGETDDLGNVDLSAPYDTTISCRTDYSPLKELSKPLYTPDVGSSNFQSKSIDSKSLTSKSTDDKRLPKNSTKSLNLKTVPDEDDKVTKNIPNFEANAKIRASIARGPEDTLEQGILEPIRITIGNVKPVIESKIILSDIELLTDEERTSAKTKKVEQPEHSGPKWKRMVNDVSFSDHGLNFNSRRVIQKDAKAVVNAKTDVKLIKDKIDKRNVVRNLVPSRNHAKNWKSKDFAEQTSPHKHPSTEKNDPIILETAIKVKRNKIRNFDPKAEFTDRPIRTGHAALCILSDGRQFESTGNLEITSRTELNLRVSNLTLIYLKYIPYNPKSKRYQNHFEVGTKWDPSIDTLYRALEKDIKKCNQNVFLDPLLEGALVRKVDAFLPFCDRQHNISPHGWEVVLNLREKGIEVKGYSFHKQYAERIALLKLFKLKDFLEAKGMDTNPGVFCF